MKYTDAHWEIRNLGVRTLEITIELSDTPSDFHTNIDKSIFSILVR